MKKTWDKENTELFFLLFLSFISVYFLPQIVSRVFFIFIIIFAFRSRKDYFWLMLFFVLNNAPGNLFRQNSLTTLGLPLYPIAPGASFGFIELFNLAYIIKAFVKGSTSIYVFKNHIKWYYSIAIYLIIYTLIVGVDTKAYIPIIRSLLHWSWVLIFPYFIKDEETVTKISRLLFPFMFINLVYQISVFFLGTSWDGVFNTSVRSYEINSEEGEALRSGSIPFILLFSIIQAVFYLLSKDSPFKRNYLILIIIVGNLSVLISASRGWFLTFAVIYIWVVLALDLKKTIISGIRIFITAFIVIVILEAIFPVLGRQIDNAFIRLSTLQDIAEGDLTAGGTLARLTERGPRVMSKVKESPIFGWGFSPTFQEYHDEHVGNQNMLLNAGIVGFIGLMSIYLAIILTIWKYSNSPPIMARYGPPFKIFAVTLVGVYVLHSATQMWGFSIGGGHGRSLYFALYFCVVNILIVNSYRKNKEPKKSIEPLSNS